MTFKILASVVSFATVSCKLFAAINKLFSPDGMEFTLESITQVKIHTAGCCCVSVSLKNYMKCFEAFCLSQHGNITAA